MKKIVKDSGGETVGIRFTIDERRIYDIEEGSEVDFTLHTVHNKKGELVYDREADVNRNGKRK